MTLAKFLDECYMFCGLCILMHVNLKHAFACYPACANSFKENQQNALEDYISTSVMLQYNSK